MSAKTAPRRTRARRGEGDKLREEILEATERLIIREGSADKVSVRDIAEEVGCTPPSIYLHFEDRNALIFAVCERIFQALETVSREASTGVTDPVEAVRRCGRAYVRFGLDHPEQYRIMFMSRTQDAISPLLLERLKQSSGFGLVVERAQKCVDAGMFPDEDAFFLACGLWSSVHGITSLLIAKPWFPWPDVERLVDHVIDTHCLGLTMCFALFMAMLDNTVVNVALPTISRDLGAGVSGLQWTVDGYVLAFATLLLTGGILGDKYGRKRMFMSGLVIFTLASLLSGLSQTTGQLIGSRALQGVGAALLMPGTLSILTVTFPPSERAKAIGIWAGVSGLALALGPTAGGLLVEHVGWESIFFLNVPIGLLALGVASRVVGESRVDEARHLDVGGLLLGTAGLFSLTYALIEANQRGWDDPLIVGTLVGGLGFLALFLLWERRTPRSMMPLHFFRIPAFSAGNAVALSLSLGMFGTFFFFSLYMQLVRGYSPLATGVRILPLTGMIFFVAPQAGRFAQRFGSRWPMTIGPILAGTGLFIVSRSGVDTPYPLMAPFLSVMGIGMGMTMAPMTAAVMNAVGPQRAGVGSATTNTSREVGGLLGIALLGTLLTTQLRESFASAISTLGLETAQQAEIIASAGHLRLDPGSLQGLLPAQAEAIRDAFAAAFIDGFRLAGAVAAGFVVLAGIVANRFIPGTPPHDDAVPEPPPVRKKTATVKKAPRPATRSNGRKPATRTAASKPGALRKTTTTGKSAKR